MNAKIIRVSLVIALLLGAHFQVFASSDAVSMTVAEDQGTTGPLAQSHWADTPLSEARSIGELPKDVKVLLERDEYGGNDIADRGGKFNSGDVGGGPFRRFIIAGISAHCVIVAIEHGGIGYSIQAFAFERIDALWQGGRAHYWFRAPPSFAELQKAR